MAAPPPSASPDAPREAGPAAGPGGSGGVLSYFVRHRTAANLLLVVLVVLGVTILPQMRAQFFPDIVVDNVSVNVAWPGAGAADIDRGAVQLLEPALLAVDGVTSASSTSREGRARIVLEFEPGHDIARAAEDVGQAVDRVANLPEDIEEILVRRGEWRDRVTDVVITGPVALEQLGLFADEMVQRLFAEGVTRVTVSGIAAPAIVIEVTSASLVRHDLSMEEISRAIARETTASPAGEVSGGNTRLRTGVERRGAARIGAIVLRARADGSTLTVADVARVRSEGIDRNTAFFVGGNPAVTLNVDRTARGDSIGIQRQVEEIAAEIQAGLPEGVEIALYRTRSEVITGRLQILVSNGLMGLALVVGLLFLFLSARTAFWVAAGIPVAMLTAIGVMYFAGLTLNMISLFALIITLGIVVDDAIVVGEHADWRARHLGEDPETAAERAARRMALPVFAATLTTVIAFFGLTAIGGRFGSLIADIPLTVIAVLAASLVECFLILPNHMAHALRAAREERWYDWPSRTVNRGFRVVRDRGFRPLMALVIRARYPVVAAMVLLLATQATLVLRGDVTWRFFDAPELGSITGSFAMLPGATRTDTLAMMQEVQRAAEALGADYADRYGADPVQFMIGQIGGGGGMGGDTREADLTGSVTIELIDADERPYSVFQFIGELQASVQGHPLMETLSFRGFRGGPGGSALEVDFFGADSATLKAAAEALKAAVADFPEVSGVEDNLPYDKDELVLELTPQGAALGFATDAVGRVLRHRLGGIEAASWPEGGRSATVRVELPSGEQTADFLETTMMRAPSGIYVPLSDIVRATRTTGFATIRRENGLQIVRVTGDISEDDPRRAEEITMIVRERIVPAIEGDFGVVARIGGLAEQERSFLADARTGLILTLTGIFLVLAWVFSSWTRPVVVMAVIPFGLIGAIWGHHVWGVPLSMFSVVGLIGMTGIIINDSIVLVSTVDGYARDRGLVPALIDAAADRRRPVLLTTLTTVLGLAPLLYETSSQAQFLRPTVITLSYGLGFGMVIVLLLVP
ncbi:MAG: efflux RND transporter permease subunit, partial [Rhodobacteraceae bacterium]|nr:efflux RND transporter permease subunit [Paracoccaceae bacterium]